MVIGVLSLRANFGYTAVNIGYTAPGEAGRRVGFPVLPYRRLLYGYLGGYSTAMMPALILVLVFMVVVILSLVF
jgi:hypothetical protein